MMLGSIIKTYREWKISGDTEWLKKHWPTVKKVMARCAALFCGTEAECRADLQQMAPLADALGRLVGQYTDRYVALKRQEKLLDYNDLEHKALAN